MRSVKESRAKRFALAALLSMAMLLTMLPANMLAVQAEEVEDVKTVESTESADAGSSPEVMQEEAKLLSASEETEDDSSQLITKVELNIDQPIENAYLPSYADCVTTVNGSTTEDAYVNVSWDSGDEKAVMGKTYTASVVVNPCYPYQFDETTIVTVNGKKVSASLNEYGKLTVSNAVSFTAKEATLVTAAEITLFDTLYEGRAMNDSTNWIWSEEKGYSTLIFWENNEDERSIAGKEYTAALKVYPASGCKFDETTAVKVNGKEVTASLNEDGTLSIAETFTITAKKGELVTEAKITIAKPVAGTELDIWGSCEDENSYSSFVSWSPTPEDGIAVAGTDYTATVRVTSIYGHSFDKTTKVTVNGKKVNASLNEYGQLVFTYVFAADSSYTGLKYVNGSWLSDGTLG